MTLNSLLAEWRTRQDIFENIPVWGQTPAREAVLHPFPEEIHPKLGRTLIDLGIDQLFIHQWDAWNQVRERQNIVLATGTASGKSLAFNLPVIDQIIRSPHASALYIYPTKALAQDQLTSIQKLIQQLEINSPPPIAALYDGDTPAAHRSTIRTNARLVLTNPDMLHTGMLPHHTIWSRFFQDLQFIVIDEIHTYRGVFGSHLANLIRRLKRVARFYGSNPLFMLTSATIANPGKHAEHLIESPVKVIDRDGSPHGERNFLIYNPPIVDPDLGIRKGMIAVAVELAESIIRTQTQTLMFGRSRKTIELVVRELHQRFPKESGRIAGYRSGYLASQRRRIEKELRQKDLLITSATNALELGIDIGGLDLVFMLGYPGSIAAVLQQSGRAGRRDLPSASVLIASAHPIDQYIVRHPEYVLERSPEQALCNPNNALILLNHIRCAAFELPFFDDEGFGALQFEEVQPYLQYLAEQGIVHHSKNKYYWMADQYPASGVSLRSASAEQIQLVLKEEISERVIGDVDIESAPWMIHPGAVYIHSGETYQVETLDLNTGRADLRPFNGDYFTEPIRSMEIQRLSSLKTHQSRFSFQGLGEVEVTTQVVGYKAIHWLTRENLGAFPLDLPPATLRTIGVWLGISDESVQILSEKGLWLGTPNQYGQNWEQIKRQVRARDNYTCQMCGLVEDGKTAHHVHHKTPFRMFVNIQEANQLSNLISLCPSCHRRAETVVRIRSGLLGFCYAANNLAPILLMCDIDDIGSAADYQSSVADGKPAIVLYDRVQDGIGLSEALFDQMDELVRKTYELVSGCNCSDGCPACVGVGGELGSGGKAETLAILELLSSEISG